MADTDAPLRTFDLDVRYDARSVLSRVCLTVPKGSVYVLLGRNGAGKSSLIRCALGHQKPTAGRVTLWGRDSWAYRYWAMKRVGVVPEVPDAPSGMTTSR